MVRTLLEMGFYSLGSGSFLRLRFIDSDIPVGRDLIIHGRRAVAETPPIARLRPPPGRPPQITGSDQSRRRPRGPSLACATSPPDSATHHIHPPFPPRGRGAESQSTPDHGWVPWKIWIMPRLQARAGLSSLGHGISAGEKVCPPYSALGSAGWRSQLVHAGALRIRVELLSSIIYPPLLLRLSR